jgi:hypothetical protein
MADSRSHLRKIVDLLGPGMWLELDRVAFAYFFGIQLDNSVDERNQAFAAAQEWASEQRAVCIPDETDLRVRFGRAYFKHNNPT